MDSRHKLWMIEVVLEDDHFQSILASMSPSINRGVEHCSLINISSDLWTWKHVSTGIKHFPDFVNVDFLPNSHSKALDFRGLAWYSHARRHPTQRRICGRICGPSRCLHRCLHRFEEGLPGRTQNGHVNDIIWDLINNINEWLIQTRVNPNELSIWVFIQIGVSLNGSKCFVCNGKSHR